MSREFVQGKVTLVTGAGSGIGRATALLLAEEGASFVAVADTNLAGAQQTADEVEAFGAKAIPVQCDVSDDAAVTALVDRVVAAAGRLDAAVNCAGVQGPHDPVADVTDDDWRRVVAVNLDGTFYCMRAELRAMADHSGCSIVNISSAVAVDPIPNMGAYNATKAAVNALTRSTAAECLGRGIRVNAVMPSGIKTGMMAQMAETEEGRATIAARLTMGRMAEPRELAEAVVWLCSSGAGWVTGLTMLVDGGSHAFRS